MGGAPVVIALVGLVFPITLLLAALLFDAALLAWALFRWSRWRLSRAFAVRPRVALPRPIPVTAGGVSRAH